MIPKHPYCRTCGSKISSASVCHHCGCEPLKGNNYCCDCGTTTLPQAIMCVQCGASLQKKMAATLAVLIGSIMVIGLSIAGYFISKENEISQQNTTDTLHAIQPLKNNPILDKPKKNKEIKNIIINNIAPNNFRKESTVDKLAKKVARENLHKETKKELPLNKIVDEKPVQPLVNLNQEKVTINVFSRSLISSYHIYCTYFTGKKKSNVIFFTTNVYGYLIINGKLFELQGIEKSNDVAKFSSSLYDVTIEIEGLSGNENEWLASGTLLVKDKRNRIIARRVVNSSCTDF